MTKKHFEAVAKGLRESVAPISVVEMVAREIYKVCPSFDEFCFIKACGFRYVCGNGDDCWER